MNLFDFYFKQIVTQSVMDWVFEQAELADKNMMADFLSVGITEGFEVNQNNLGADMSVDILQGAAYSTEGQRINNTTPLTNQSCSVDEYGVDTTVQTVGNEKWISVFARFTRNLEDPAIDGNGLEVYTRQYEDVEFIIRQAAEATSGTATQPALLEGAVLLADIKLSYGQTTIQTSHIDSSRRQDWMRLTGSTLSELVSGNPHDAIDEIYQLLDGWAATGSPFSFTQEWYGPTAVAGPSAPITSMAEALNAIVYDLAQTTGTGGAGLIGVGDASGTYVSWTSSSLNNALGILQTALNSHIAGSAPYHPSTAITQAAKSESLYSIPSTTVDNAIGILLGLINDRVIAPETAPSAPVLMWRSHGITLDANITNDTVSIYWQNSGTIWILKGLYMSANSTFNTNATAGGLVTVWGLNDGYINHGLKICGVSESFSYSELDDYETVNPDLSKTRVSDSGYQREYWVGSHSAETTPQVAKSRIWYVDSLELAMWVSGDSATLGTGGFYITYNAEWSNTTNTWSPSDTDLQTACAIEFSTAGILLKNITDEAAGWLTNWSDSGWTRIVRWSSLERQQETELPADTNYNCAQIEGDVFERCLIAGAGYTDVAAATVSSWEAIQYRNKRYDTPTTFSVQSVTAASNDGSFGTPSAVVFTPNGFTVSDYEKWGIYMYLACTFDAGDSGKISMAAIVDIY